MQAPTKGHTTTHHPHAARSGQLSGKKKNSGIHTGRRRIGKRKTPRRTNCGWVRQEADRALEHAVAMDFCFAVSIHTGTLIRTPSGRKGWCLLVYSEVNMKSKLTSPYHTHGALRHGSAQQKTAAASGRACGVTLGNGLTLFGIDDERPQHLPISYLLSLNERGT